MKFNEITPAEIAAAMGLSESRAWEFAHNISRYYKPERLQKFGKKIRIIDALYKSGKQTLRKLHRWFQKNKLYHPCAHGGVKKRSCFTSANCHLGSKAVWTRDAKDCYPSITPDVFCKELKQIGFRHDSAKLLTLLCTVRNRIPQGSPVSNDALNLFLFQTDELVRKNAALKKCRFGRVADDFIISDKSGIRGDDATQLIEEELRARGIKINTSKRRKVGFQPGSKTQIVHSIDITRRGGSKISKEHWDAARAAAEKYLRSCRCVQFDTLIRLAHKRRVVEGYLNYCRQAKFSPSKYLFSLFRAGDRHVARKLALLKITAHKGRWWLIVRDRYNEPLRIAKIWEKRVSAAINN